MNPDFYNPTKDEIDKDNVLETTDADPFTVGQSYEEHPADQLRCRRCGSTEFHLATGDYFTAIRCPKCRYELCIHEG